MSIWFAVAALLLFVGVALLITSYPYKNRKGSRRCPRCQYEIHPSAIGRCSECGYTWKAESELRRRPAKRVGLVGGVASISLSFVALLFAQHWTYYVPKPALTWALQFFAHQQPIPRGSNLPLPDASLKDSPNRWHRLVWQYQHVQAFDRFLTLVAQSNATDKNLEQLVPLMIEAHSLFEASQQGQWQDAWVLRNFMADAERRRREIDDRSTMPLCTWALSELQLFYGSAETDNANWISPPLDILEPLSHSKDAAVRSYVIERVAMIGSRNASIILERLANDPDPDVEQKAIQTLQWRRDIRGWP